MRTVSSLASQVKRGWRDALRASNVGAQLGEPIPSSIQKPPANTTCHAVILSICTAHSLLLYIQHALPAVR